MLHKVRVSQKKTVTSYLSIISQLSYLAKNALELEEAKKDLVPEVSVFAVLVS